MSNELTLERIEVEDDGRYDLCEYGHSRIWHFQIVGECVAEVRYFPEQMAQCSCPEFRLRITAA